MGTPRDISMEISAADLAFVADSERITHRGGVAESLSVLNEGAGTVDSYTDEFTPNAPVWVALTGTFCILTEEDALVGMEGKVQVGDYVASFYGPDVAAYVETKQIRRNSDGRVYNVAARMRIGLGQTPDRVEFALKRDASQDA